MTARWALMLVGLVAGLSQAGPSARLEGDRLVLQNDFVRRTLVRQGDVWRTQSFSRADGTDEVKVQSDEFLIRLMDGPELTAADFRAAEAPQVSEAKGVASARILYQPLRAVAGGPLSVEVTYSLGDEPYLRKSLRLAMPAGGAVDALQVERFRTAVPCDRGGYGEPVFVGKSWFFGLEYPACDDQQRAGLVTLGHFPGLAKHDEATGAWLIQSKTAVAGVGKPGDALELAFSDYVDTIRRPSRNFLQYNSWYDWRGDELSLPNLVATFEGFKRNLLDPYGLKMDAFVPDDGYQNYQSIWVPRKNLYPEGFGPLREALEARGTRLGLWMPLNGTNLDTDWGARQGYEKSNQGGFYCLVGPKYNAAIREATRRIITQGNLAYYKHDFNTLRCTAPDHGHLPDDRHGHEANLDAELALLAYERSLQPDIFLNITSSVWLSPWWLMHADSVWMCAGDFGYDKTFPQLSPREWDMSYRDAHFYQVYHRERRLVPVSAMMTHGIIEGKYARLGGDEETRREWSDMVVMYYGRGVQLKELYLTPDLLPRDWWPVLGEATRWAVENCKTLENEVMVGGDPRQGQIYGYAHWRGDRGLYVLRNPGLQDRAFAAAFDKSVRYRGEAGRAFQGRVIYPYREALPTAFTSGQPAHFDVPGCSVMVFELRPGAPPPITPAGVPALQGATAELKMDAAGRSRLTVHVPVPDEEMQRCDLYLLARGPARGLDFRGLSLNGRPAKPRAAEHSGWCLCSLDLRSLRGKDADVVASLPGGGDVAFSAPNVTVSAWFVADRPTSSAPAAGAEDMPLPISQMHRRQTVPLLREVRLERARPRRSLTQADLQTVVAAKLRIRVFDVNSEPQYQGKCIFLNGEKLMPIPPNTGELSAWQEFILDLTAEQRKLLRLSNSLSLDNAGGDCYKFTGLSLAVQLPDGTWVQGTTDETVHSSAEGWAYTEGEVFRDGTSGPITVEFR